MRNFSQFLVLIPHAMQSPMRRCANTTNERDPNVSRPRSHSKAYRGPWDSVEKNFGEYNRKCVRTNCIAMALLFLRPLLAKTGTTRQAERSEPEAIRQKITGIQTRRRPVRRLFRRIGSMTLVAHNQPGDHRVLLSLTTILERAPGLSRAMYRQVGPHQLIGCSKNPS